MAAISRAWVQEVVSRTPGVGWARICDRSVSACRVKRPLPEMWRASKAARMASNSAPLLKGRLKGILGRTLMGRLARSGGLGMRGRGAVDEVFEEREVHDDGDGVAGDPGDIAAQLERFGDEVVASGGDDETKGVGGIGTAEGGPKAAFHGLECESAMEPVLADDGDMVTDEPSSGGFGREVGEAEPDQLVREEAYGTADQSGHDEPAQFAKRGVGYLIDVGLRFGQRVKEGRRE